MDFAFKDRETGILVGVEIDGSPYHNKVKDEARDNYLFELGWRIIRFDAGETYKDPFKIAQKVSIALATLRERELNIITDLKVKKE